MTFGATTTYPGRLCWCWPTAGLGMALWNICLLAQLGLMGFQPWIPCKELRGKPLKSQMDFFGFLGFWRFISVHQAHMFKNSIFQHQPAFHLSPGLEATRSPLGREMRGVFTWRRQPETGEGLGQQRSQARRTQCHWRTSTGNRPGSNMVKACQTQNQKRLGYWSGLRWAKNIPKFRWLRWQGEAL